MKWFQINWTAMNEVKTIRSLDECFAKKYLKWRNKKRFSSLYKTIDKEPTSFAVPHNPKEWNIYQHYYHLVYKLWTKNRLTLRYLSSNQAVSSLVYISLSLHRRKTKMKTIYGAIVRMRKLSIVSLVCLASWNHSNDCTTVFILGFSTMYKLNEMYTKRTLAQSCPNEQ